MIELTPSFLIFLFKFLIVATMLWSTLSSVTVTAFSITTIPSSSTSLLSCRNSRILTTTRATTATASLPFILQMAAADDDSAQGGEPSGGGDGSSNNEDGLKALLETPEIMDLLQSSKMQEAMQLVLAGKQDELQQRVQEDPEFQEIVEKLNEIFQGPQ